jgi:preprotein translocase subunit YajC
VSALVFLPILLILFYLLLIRPQQQRARAQQRLMSSIGIGDRIVTIGGIVGTIAELRGDHVVVEMVDGARVEFLRQAVSRKIEGGLETEPEVEEADGEWWDDEHDGSGQDELAIDDAGTDQVIAPNGNAPGAPGSLESNGHAPLDVEPASQSEEDPRNR